MPIDRPTVSLLLLFLATACGDGGAQAPQQATPAPEPKEPAPAAQSTLDAGAQGSGTPRSAAKGSGNQDFEEPGGEAASSADPAPSRVGAQVEPLRSPAAEETAADAEVAAPGLAAPDPTAGWRRYALGNGAFLLHPPDWKAQAGPEGLQFLAPGADPERELVLASASDAAGLTDPLAIATRARLDGVVRSTLPGLRRLGRGRAVATGVGNGAAYDYRGTTPTGQKVRARVFVTIQDGALGGLTVIAEEDLFDARAAIVETMFTSISRGEAQPSADGDGGTAPERDIDPRLVGRFTGESIASGSGVYVNTQLVYAFNADGTVLFGAQSHMSASERDVAGNLRWTATGASGADVDRGRWSAKGGVLDIRWDGGATARFAYGFEPDGTLALRNARTRKLIDIYRPVR